MILSYMTTDNKPHTKIITKFWQGNTGIKYELKDTKQIIEIKDVKQSFIYDRDAQLQSFSKDKENK